MPKFWFFNVSAWRYAWYYTRFSDRRDQRLDLEHRLESRGRFSHELCRLWIVYRLTRDNVGGLEIARAEMTCAPLCEGACVFTCAQVCTQAEVPKTGSWNIIETINYSTPFARDLFIWLGILVDIRLNEVSLFEFSWANPSTPVANEKSSTKRRISKFLL